MQASISIAPSLALPSSNVLSGLLSSGPMYSGLASPSHPRTSTLILPPSRCPSGLDSSFFSLLGTKLQSYLWNTITLGGMIDFGRDTTRVMTSEYLSATTNHLQSHNLSASSSSSSSNWSDEEKELRHIPQYVLDHAPFVHLYSGEEYWPGHIFEHLQHTTPAVDYELVDKRYQNPTLDNLNEINNLGRNTYLQSKDDPEQYPDWLSGRIHIPEELAGSRGPKTGRTKSNPTTTTAHRSSAPAFLFVVDKGAYVDAFWFYFYSFNLGNAVLGVRFGNHVGDWEHTCIRFRDGEPVEVFFSEHEWGAAYTWDAVEKMGDRLVSYSAVGTHAMYASPGIHQYILPFGLLQDLTDRGPLWDPTLNLYAYTYNVKSDTVRSSDLSPDAPTGWFHFWGRWGDKFYRLDDPRQYRFGGELHYVSGPSGPKFKHLGRGRICEGNDEDACKVRPEILNEIRVWKPLGNGENGTDEENWRRFLDRKRLDRPEL